MAEQKWDTHPNGDTAVYPVTGWGTAIFMDGMAGGLRIEFATEPSLKQRSANQFVLTPAQVRELSQVLAHLAGRMEEQLAANKPKGPAN